MSQGTALQPVRVAHVVPTLSAGGVATYIAQIAETGDSSVDTTVIPLFSHPSRPQVSISGTRIIPLGFAPGEIEKSQTIVSALTEVLRHHRIDIVHSHHVYSDLFALPASNEASCRALRTVHGILQISPDDGFRKTSVRHDWSQAEIERELSIEAYAQLTICVSMHAQERILRYGIPRSKTLVIENGVDLVRFRLPSLTERETAREDFALAPNEIVIGFLGRLEKSKNPLMLPALASALYKRYNAPLRFLVQGSGPEEDALRAAVVAEGLKGAFLLRPFTFDVRRFLAAVDIFCLPSLAEGCPFVVLEAMASGLPVVAARVGGVPEIIRNGADGFTFDPSDVRTAAGQIGDLMASENRQSVGSRARMRVVANFEMHTQVGRLLAVYRSIGAGTIA